MNKFLNQGFYALSGFFLFLSFFFHAQDSTSSLYLKTPRHYFPTVLILDYYQMPELILKNTDAISSRIHSYQIKQSTLVFHVPILTLEKLNPDSTVMNFSFLLSGLFLNFHPKFSGLRNEHVLVKNGLGLRVVVNNGRKSIFFIDVSPFVTKDRGYAYTNIYRMAGTLLWSYSPMEKFSLRLGITKSFLWGNRFYLPFVGFRLGRTDRTYFSFQFPRQILFTFPIGKFFRMSWFTRPQGGLFTLANIDSLYNAFPLLNKKIFLGRFEFLSGLRLDIYPARWCFLYISAGRSIHNYLALYSLTFNKNRRVDFAPFFENFPDRQPFFNFGVNFLFGKTKSSYQRYTVQEQINLQNSIGPVDENLMILTRPSQKKFTPKTEEISDLINSFDY